MELTKVLPQLKAWFPVSEHKDRDLPGGGRWYYVPWQSIRARLDEVCPDWQVSYGEPTYVDKYCVVSCTLTICGVSRQAIGNAQIELISGKGKDMARGTPIERAIADAFKNAAEAFGVAAYLDEQADDKTKQSFVRYMQSQGNGRAAQNYLDNQRIENGQPPRQKPVDPPSKPFGQSVPKTAPRKTLSVRSAGIPPQPELEPQERRLSEEEKKVVLGAIAGDINRLRWTPQQGKASIEQRYQKSEVRHLTDGELLHFSAYLSGLPDSAEAAEFDMALGNV